MERREQPGKAGNRVPSVRSEGGNEKSRRTPAKDAALCGLMCALAFLFGYVEMLIPVNLGVPGVKLGLANLVSIVSLYLLGARRTVLISLVRVILTGFTFGNLSVMMYSMGGAILSLIAMIFCRKADLFGVTGVSIAGGVFHNIGQLIVAALVLESANLFYYLPVLLLAGTVSGACIGLLGAMAVKRLSRVVPGPLS
jgi:heptaprenyl diphosphate synthase